MTHVARLALAALAVIAPACDLEPDVGPARSERCSNTDTDPDRKVSFNTDVNPLLLRESFGCIPCHDPTREGAIGVSLGGLDVTSRENLMRGGVRSGASIVQSGRPCQSILYQKLSAGPPFGSRMPLNGPPFLSEVELAVIHDWIAEGAGDN